MRCLSYSTPARLAAPAASRTDFFPASTLRGRRSAFEWTRVSRDVLVWVSLHPFLQHPEGMSPRIDAAHRAVVAPVARRFGPFAVGIHLAVPGKDAPAHFPERLFDAIEQGEEFLRLEQGRVGPVGLARFGESVIELATVFARPTAVELLQGILIDPAGMP